MAYLTDKSVLQTEEYFTQVDTTLLKQTLSRFRCDCHPLMIKIGRRNGIDPECHLCRYCLRFNILVEIEYVIFDNYIICPTFNDLRN